MSLSDDWSINVIRSPRCDLMVHNFIFVCVISSSSVSSYSFSRSSLSAIMQYPGSASSTSNHCKIYSSATSSPTLYCVVLQKSETYNPSKSVSASWS